MPIPFSSALSQAPPPVAPAPSGLSAQAHGLLRDLMTVSDPGLCDSTIRSVMARIGACCGAEQVVLLTIDETRFSCAAEWHGPAVAPIAPFLQNLPLAAFEMAVAPLREGQVFAPGQTADLPGGALRGLLERLGVERLLLLPFTTSNVLAGALGLGHRASAAPPSEAEVRLLGLLTEGLNCLLTRRDGEQALEAARREQTATLARLKATLSSTPDLLLEMDRDGRCLGCHCNRPELLADSPARIVGRTMEETLPPQVAALQRQTMEAARAEGVAEAPVYALGRGARKRWYHLTVARRDIAQGDDTGVAFIFRIRDVTREHARDKRVRLLDRIIADMPLMVILLNAEMRIDWANPAFEAHTGLPLSQLRGRRKREFTDAGATDPQVLEEVDSAAKARRGTQAVICRRVGGRLCWVEMIIRPYRDARGQFSGFFVIEHDVTDRRRIEADHARLAEAAEAARIRLNAALEALDDGFVMFDADGRLILCNSRYRQINAAIADVIVPGVHLEDIARAGRERGMYAQSRSEVDAQTDWLMHPEASDRVNTEILYADGRILRATAARMPDGGHVGLRSDITEIRTAQRKLADVIDGARVATWDHEVQTDTETVNAHWAAMVGMPAQGDIQIDDAAWRALIHPEDAARIAAQMDRIRRGQADGIEDEFRLRHGDGHWVHVITRGRVVARDARGMPVRMSGVDIDITLRRRFEERLRMILDASAVGTWQSDYRSGRMVVDEAYAGILGMRLDEIQPMTPARFEELLHPDDRIANRARVAEAALSGSSHLSHEFRMRHRDGGWRWILSKTRVHEWGADGEVLSESGVHLDITEAHEREAALAEARDALAAALTARQAAERRMADIAALSDDWFWEQDAGLRLTYLSEGFARSTGLDPARVLGRTPREMGLMGAGKAQGDWKRLGEAQEGRTRFSDALIRYAAPGRPGETVCLRINGAPFVDSEGRFAGFRGVGSNVTSLIDATERAEAASRAKSQFLATMSHELRTPLTAVLGLTELMEGRLRDEELRGMLATIRDSGTGLLAVLDDILDLAKIEAGKLTLDPAPFVPADLARRCEALFRPRAEESGLEMRVEIVPGCEVPRTGDANRILQVLHNLIGNAVKFTRSGGIRIHLAPTREDGAELRFCVEDDGIGMSGEQLARAFDEFEQAEGSTARRFGGTGLGLPITRRLVGLLGGTLTLRSRPGQGTRAEFVLPLPRCAPPAPLADDPPAASLAGLKVLVADDNATNRRILEAMLRGLGLEPTLVEDGVAAVAAYRPRAYDMLLLEISMPGLDGPAALRAMRAADRASGAAAPPALAVTAHAMAHQVAQFMEDGFVGHVAKPFSRQSLARAIATHRQTGARKGPESLSRLTPLP